jgi:hypothetical protein
MSPWRQTPPCADLWDNLTYKEDPRRRKDSDKLSSPVKSRTCKVVRSVALATQSSQTTKTVSSSEEHQAKSGGYSSEKTTKLTQLKPGKKDNKKQIAKKQHC